MEFPYITVVLGLSFKGLDKTLHPIIGASYFVRIGAREKPVNPSKGIGFTQPVTGIASLPTIGNIVKYNNIVIGITSSMNYFSYITIVMGIASSINYFYNIAVSLKL